MRQSKAAALLVLGMAASGLAPALAADNSGIVILDSQRRSTPFGHYESHRRTQVFGPDSGYRYEEYSYPPPGTRVYPGYGAGYVQPYPRHGHRHRGQGRVIERFGPGHERAAPQAPRIEGYANPYRQRWGNGPSLPWSDRSLHSERQSIDR